MDFKSKFLNNYWSEIEKARFREIYIFWKYNQNLKHTEENYALKLIKNERYLDPTGNKKRKK